jgi:hypothetical protein
MDKKINDYIKKQKSPQKEICEQLRKLIHKTLPKAEEEMKWGVPTFAGGKFYIGSLKDHVNLGFSIVGLAKEEASLFEGAGKLMRHIEIAKTEDIDLKKLIKLLKLVDKKASCAGC